jgi:hypothetical protein
LRLQDVEQHWRRQILAMRTAQAVILTGLDSRSSAGIGKQPRNTAEIANSAQDRADP